MYEMTLSGLLRAGSSWFVENEVEIMVIVVQVNDDVPELIINNSCNISNKLKYYSEAYNEDLTLKANSNIKIVNYNFYKNWYDLAKAMA